MKNILFPTDFLESASNALSFAADISSKANANLILLHSLNGKEEEEFAMERMKKVENELLKKYEKTFTISSIIAEANLSAAVKSLEKRKKIDMIVMGTNGITNVGKAFFGNNTAKVIDTARSPVLAIPSDVTLKPILNIAYATDYTLPEMPIVKKAVKFAELFEANLMFLHIIDKEESGAIENGRHYINAIKNKINYQKISYHFVQTNDIIEGITDFVSEYKIDVLTLATHHKGFFESMVKESVTKIILNEMIVPLLVQHKKSVKKQVEKSRL